METVAAGAVEVPRPEPIFNCPQCGRWVGEGTLECPECGMITYSGYLRVVATHAMAEEKDEAWDKARALWAVALEWLPPGEQAAAVEKKMGELDARIQRSQKSHAKWTKRLGPLAPVVFFLAKLKTVFFFLLKAKFMLSFVGFFAVYWALFGWKFGLGFTLSIFVHEMGHYAAARQRGLKVDLPVFLPGLGAYVRWYAMGVSLESLAAIALAGPTFGLAFGLGCAGLAAATGSPLFSALAHVTAWLNVLNLIPVLGLDGAQATYALDKTQRWLVTATAVLFFVLLREWTFLGVGLGMGWRLYRGGYAEKASSRTMAGYILLLFALGVVMLRFPDTTLAR